MKFTALLESAINRYGADTMRSFWISNSLTIAALAGSILLFFTPSRADERDMLNIEEAVKHKICAGNGRYQEFSCDKECGGSGYCTPPHCQQFSDKECTTWAACAHQVERTNAAIAKYNSTCDHSQTDNNQGHRLPGEKNPEQTQKAAEAARLKAQEAFRKAVQERSASQADIESSKAQAKVQSSACQLQVKQCNERNESLASHQTAETTSQCQAYCNALQIENCNVASKFIKGAEESCRADAINDRRQAQENDRLVREKERRKEEEANRIPDGWQRCSCPGDHMHLVQLGRAKRVDGVLYHGGDAGPCRD